MSFMFSDALAFRRDPLAFVKVAAGRSKEPLVPLHLGASPVLLVADPALLKPILKADERIIGKGRHIEKLKPIFGESSLTMHAGPEQRNRRAALHSILSRGSAGKMAIEMSAEIRAEAARVSTFRQFNASALGTSLAIKLLSVAVFGRNVLSAVDQEMLTSAIRLVEDGFNDDMFRVLPLLPWQRRRRERSRARVRSVLEHLVSRVRDQAGESSALRALVTLGLSTEEISDEIITLLIAGQHTTGVTIAWMLRHMALDPDLAHVVREEATQVSDRNGEIGDDGLRAARITSSVVNECLRLYPAAWWFVREVKTATVLLENKLSAGTCLLITPWQLHRDPRYWVQPDSFQIDRDFSNRAFIPFGAGPRACIGMGLAMLELQLVALEFASAFDFGGVLPEAAQPTASVTLKGPDAVIEVRPAGDCRRLNAAA